MNELMRVAQLPVIEEQLRTQKDKWQQIAQDAEAVVCTVDTIQAIKAIRAEIRKVFDETETPRKAIKAAIMAQYDAFEANYNDCIANYYRIADAILARKIRDTENGIKQQCEKGLREYFAELCIVRGLDWLTYEQADIAIDMASAKAKTPKRLREQLAVFVTRVGDSVDRIIELDNADEIMVEFRRSLDAADAICTVQERHKRIQEEIVQREAREAVRAQKRAAEDKIIQVEKTFLQPPVVTVQPADKSPGDIIPKCTFTVYNAPRRVLKQIKEILEMEGIRYE